MATRRQTPCFCFTERLLVKASYVDVCRFPFCMDQLRLIPWLITFRNWIVSSTCRSWYHRNAVWELTTQFILCDSGLSWSLLSSSYRWSPNTSSWVCSLKFWKMHGSSLTWLNNIFLVLTQGWIKIRRSICLKSIESKCRRWTVLQSFLAGERSMSNYLLNSPRFLKPTLWVQDRF